MKCLGKSFKLCAQRNPTEYGVFFLVSLGSVLNISFVSCWNWINTNIICKPFEGVRMWNWKQYICDICVYLWWLVYTCCCNLYNLSLHPSPSDNHHWWLLADGRTHTCNLRRPVICQTRPCPFPQRHSLISRWLEDFGVWWELAAPVPTRTYHQEKDPWRCSKGHVLGEICPDMPAFCFYSICFITKQLLINSCCWCFLLGLLWLYPGCMSLVEVTGRCFDRSKEWGRLTWFDHSILEWEGISISNVHITRYNI